MSNILSDKPDNAQSIDAAQLTDDMVDGMDDTAGLLPGHLPASSNSAFFWRGSPSAIGRSLKPSNKDRSTTARYSYAIEGREAGLASFHKRDALKRGGI